MEAVTLVARLDGLTASDVIEQVHSVLIEPVFPLPSSVVGLTLLRRSVATWAFLYLGALFLYFTCSTLDILVLAAVRKARTRKGKGEGKGKGKAAHFSDATTGDYALLASDVDVASEIRCSVLSLALMTLLSVPLEVGIQLGHSKVYHHASDHPLPYLLLSPLLFILFSDMCIYFIHRGLHHRSIYRHIHKGHHAYVNTTAFAAFAFHPLDGFMQGISYQAFVYIFPFHSVTHLVSMSCVLLWTINIHDRASFGIPGVNGAAHHTIHHTTFRSNYGQYFTLWDRLFGTYRDPFAWQKSGAKAMTEREVYGKDA